jgi:hypothetical protein
MVVSQIIAPETPQVLFVQRNHMIQHLAAATPNPALGHSVLPWTAHARADGREAAGLEKPEYISTELRVTVEHDVLVATGKRQSLPQLLDDPIAGRMRRGVEMQNSPPIMLDDKEAIEYAERYGWNREEVECGDHFAVIAEEGQPTFRLAFMIMTF